MNNIETSEIISVKSYFGSMLIGTLPILGDIMLFNWSKDRKVRENKRNLCKAYLLLKLVMWYPVLIAMIVLSLLV